MASLSPNLLRQLEETLLKCGSFDKLWQLNGLFVDARISDFRNDVPDNLTTPNERVGAIISVLLQREDSSGQNALVLFIEVLVDRKKPNDGCHSQLLQLAEKVQAELGEDKSNDSHPPLPNPAPNRGNIDKGDTSILWRTVMTTVIIITLILVLFSIVSLVASILAPHTPDTSQTTNSIQTTTLTPTPSQTLEVASATASQTPSSTSTPIATLDFNTLPLNAQLPQIFPFICVYLRNLRPIFRTE